MITQEFEFRSPDKLDEVLTLLAEGGDEIKLLSGGMSLMPMMALGLVRPRIVLSLNRIVTRCELARALVTTKSCATHLSRATADCCPRRPLS
jgi:CO/xanthine dehydrogenase FAD-binding subunit